MPSEIYEVFQELKTEIIWLHGRWIVYTQLYDFSEKRIDLINECAPNFFYIIQDILLGEIIISLSKLTDLSSSHGFDNLSFEQLQLRVDLQKEKNLSNTLRKLLDDLHKKCQPFRLWRNKRLAHLDLTTAMKSSLSPLPGISKNMIEGALELIREYMNTIERYYLQSETGYEHFLMQADGEALISMLKYGLRYEELLNEGKMSWEDLHQSKWEDA